MTNDTAEQKARDLLERLDYPEAQSLSAGDVVELANLLADHATALELLRLARSAIFQYSPSGKVVRDGLRIVPLDSADGLLIGRIDRLLAG